MPSANDMTIGIMAVVAQAEREMISKRTKEALQAAKARGVRLGGFRGVHFTPEAQKAGSAARQALSIARAADLAPTLDDIRAGGVTTLHGIASELTARGIPTARGASTWAPVQVSRMLACALREVF
jgi:DNA invertase Pin-like site-specific DNA recombinase